jgi:hypothetical protein
MNAGLGRQFIVAVCASVLMAGSLAQLNAAGHHEDRDEARGINVTFTKWITSFPQMAGFTGGDAAGTFAGEVLVSQVSTNPSVTSIDKLEAIYDVDAGSHSFTALIHGGASGVTGKAYLDGRVLDGWLTGSPVHVTFQTKTDCAGAPPGVCFEGNIHIDTNHGEN